MTQTSNFFKRNRLAVGIAAVMAFGASNLQAEASAMSLDIKSQKAGKALLDLGEKAGVQIMIPPEMGKSVQLSAIRGDYSLPDALEYLLKGTGLTYEFASDGVVVIRQDDTADAANEGAGEEVDEEVVVTGTRLRTNKTYAPVQTITREDIQKRGFNSMEQLLRSISQNQSALNSASTLNNSLTPTGSQGNTSVDLRGLGSGNTLILVNGRRVSNAAGLGTSNGANIGGIALNSVERVEVMTDGGSAIYGSDAVAGTVNIILRKDYNGSETIVRFENSVNDGGAHSLSQMFGFGWDSGNLTLNLSYQKEDPVSNQKLGFTSSDLRGIGGVDGRFNMFTIAPAFFFPPFGYVPAGPAGALGPGVDPSNFSLLDIDPAAIRRIDYVPSDASTTSERKSMVLSLSQELTPSLEATLDVSYNETETRGLNERGPTLFSVVVPGSSPVNPTGTDLVLGGTFYEAVESGLISPSESLGDPSDLNVSLGVDWDMPINDWRLSASYAQSTSESSLGFTNSILVDDNFSPFELNAALAAGTFNPFDLASNSPEAWSSVLGTLRADSPENSVDTLNAYVEGKLADIPMGEMRFVFGGEYREETSSGFSGNFTTDPTRDTTSFFGEVSVPFVNESHDIPGIHSLDMKLAARWEEYDVRGEAFNAAGNAVEAAQEKFTNTSPSIQLSWYVTPELRINASLSESFKAPGANSLFGDAVQSTFFPFPVFDPRQPGTGGMGGTEFVHIFFASNPDLQPETSETTSLSVNWAPENLGVVVDVAYSKIDFTKRLGFVSVFTPESQIALLSNPANDELFAPRGPDGRLLRIVSRPINQGSSTDESIDLSVSYDIDTDLGWFEARLNGTYILKSERFLAPNTPAMDVVGTDQGNSDKIKGALTLSWERGAYGSSLTYNYASSYDDVTFDPVLGRPRIEGLSSWDLTGFYQTENGWKFAAGARNILNEQPPTISLAGLPYDPRRVDPRGRVVYAEVTKSFEW